MQCQGLVIWKIVLLYFLWTISNLQAKLQNNTEIGKDVSFGKYNISLHKFNIWIYINKSKIISKSDLHKKNWEFIIDFFYKYVLHCKKVTRITRLIKGSES